MTYSLKDFATFVRRVFALNLPEAVWVTAELAQAHLSRGHHWLTLVEKNTENDEIVAQLEGVVWASQLKAIKKTHGSKLTEQLLTAGVSVRLRVTTSFHERYGLRLVVEDVDPAHSIGALERKRQRTLENLRAEGLVERNAGLRLPTPCLRLAVISSDTAAGLADFQRELSDNPYGYQFNVHTYSAAMQGVRATPEILARFRQIERRREEYDAIVIVRGGGGRMDLAAFDEEELARGIAGANLPVVTGIGHEIDASVADLVAHTALKTPTAVAAFLINRTAAWEADLLRVGRGIVAASGMEAERSRLARLEEELRRLPALGLAREWERLGHREQLLAALSPATTLARGYALVSQDGKLVTEPGEVKKGEMKLRLRGGAVEINIIP